MLLWLGSLPKSGNLTACHVHVEAQLEVVEMSYDKVDWSVAPADATHWEMTEVGRAVWSQERLVEDGKGSRFLSRLACDDDRNFAPDFGFSGDYRNSLTSRPDYIGGVRYAFPRVRTDEISTLEWDEITDSQKYDYEYVSEILHGISRQKALDMKYVLTTLQARLRENRPIDNSERLLLLNLVNASLI